MVRTDPLIIGAMVFWCHQADMRPTCSFDGHSGYGGYVTPNSTVRNARVFDIQLEDLQCQQPKIQTYNSCESLSVTQPEARDDRLYSDENYTRLDQITLGPEFYNY
jgi:hypothetical protein